MAELAIVTSCDETYAPLAKGLILSLRAHGYPQAGQQLCLLDIGCSGTTVDWMHAHGVRVLRLNPKDHIPYAIGHLPPYVAAMAFRPFIPSVFPDFKIYLWIDADTWVQQGASIHLYQQLASNTEYDIAISPLIDVSYKSHFNAKAFKQDLERVYQAIYGEAGLKMAWQPILAAGVFAMRFDSKIWNAWAAELPVVYSRDYSLAPDAMHLAEQTALNHVVYSSGQPALLEAVHNYHLCAGAAVWIDDRLYTHHSKRLLGIVHLCGLSTYARTYVRGRAFYDRGRYLTESELNSISCMRKDP